SLSNGSSVLKARARERRRPTSCASRRQPIPEVRLLLPSACWRNQVHWGDRAQQIIWSSRRFLPPSLPGRLDRSQPVRAPLREAGEKGGREKGDSPLQTGGLSPFSLPPFSPASRNDPLALDTARRGLYRRDREC